MNKYILPFKKNDNILELGGGNNPLFHPNVDTRTCEGIDIVTDFNKPLPLESETYYGIYSSFAIEHISWRNLPQFITECYRILKTNGVAIFITANLLEQCKKIVNTPESDITIERDVCMIFGGQGLEQDTDVHKSSMTPDLAIRLFRDAGFSEIKIYEHPAKTDMIIEAKK